MKDQCRRWGWTECGTFQFQVDFLGNRSRWEMWHWGMGILASNENIDLRGFRRDMFRGSHSHVRWLAQ